MNKKDIAQIRKQFKINNDLLKISDIFNVYIMKDSSDIFHYQSQPFEMLDQEQQELFLHNFKKMLAGQLDEKLFELKFQRDADNSSQLILHQGLLSSDVEGWAEQMLKIVEKLLAVRQYEKDIVITFIRGEYYKPTKRRNDEAEESERDTVYSHPFILCSINNTQEPKKELLFDYVEKEFRYHFVMDPIINLNAPLSGFLFPCFTDNAADVNHVLYSAGKVHEPDHLFIEDVLNGEETMTAQDDKIVFEEIIKDVTGDQLSTSALSTVYEEINRMIVENEEEEPPKLDSKDVERVLKMSGFEDVDSEKVESSYQKIIDDDKYEIKASSVLPKFTSKSIKISTKVANISISPPDLRYVKQIVVDGKRYLMIEVEEETVIEGFTMIPEAFGGGGTEE
ncbi:hypothetical protein B14911_20140 [Bacillus sp. NRRL B-14911]|uniref:DUF4317 domain-containing protein n=1 Tax=Bacillus TaxID=1386 RepID=UPI00006BCEC4|nr:MULTISPECIES: DUF4317 domain-containing protein [Bacillus]OXT14863.1 hypothetical protein B9K06_24060 [Bacillus sp. OG2]EAR64190.1 hypothetical protein B14911_20140 [Bacillus sp. NRRL B-14911]MCA1037818.1 DUF4317 domain-containing protein [Bacillus infantis]MDT0163751.1 DUF4317 domain-containing protein [Bacillus sp. AG4(2022)]RYI25298.1 DUF4317 family protein [Bacillus infantis]